MIGNGFNGQEVTNALNVLRKYGVWVDIVSENLGTVIGDDGTKINVDKIFTSTYPVLFDSIYVVGGNTKNQEKFNQSVMHFINEQYKHYKPIGIATTAQSYIQPSDKNNLDGVVFASNNPNFGNDFVEAIAKQRFWNRK